MAASSASYGVLPDPETSHPCHRSCRHGAKDRGADGFALFKERQKLGRRLVNRLGGVDGAGCRAVRGAAVGDGRVFVTMFMEMSFERECVPAGALSPPGKASLLQARSRCAVAKTAGASPTVCRHAQRIDGYARQAVEACVQLVERCWTPGRNKK